MDKLLPDHLKELWQSVTRKQITAEEFYIEQEKKLSEYQNVWKQALLMEGHQDLQESLLSELGLYLGCKDLAEIELRCKRAGAAVQSEWQGRVNSDDRQSVEQFYNESEAEVYGLLWWHTLSEDASPLAYVMALHFAQKQGCRSCLDFGAGVGSGDILLARHGLSVALADISSPLLRFSQWRFAMRGLPAQFIDLKTSGLPNKTFDVVTAMDVFEHLFDPVRAVEELWKALRPGGFLLGRFHSEPNDDRAGHIVRDFGPTFERMKELGFVEVWRDEWLWGHQVFQKS
ncbi:MAG: class I SAM-dependent methyltransferase [Ignavibacteriales bacterium]